MIYHLVFRVWLLAHATGAPIDHVRAAIHAETEQVSAELLLAQAWKESHWTIFWVSRDEIQADGSRKRRIGVWRKNFPSHWRGPYFCGPSQLRRLSQKSCKAVGRDLNASYTEARDHIIEWLGLCERFKKPGLNCALAGYGGGVKATKSKKSRGWRYSLKIQRKANLYKKKIEKILIPRTGV